MLAWGLEWGEQIPMFERRAARGQSSPAYDNRPTLWTHLEEYMACFSSCSRRREDGTHAIPISEIVSWLNLYQIEDVDDRLEYFSFVDELDKVFVEHFSQKQKERMSKK